MIGQPHAGLVVFGDSLAGRGQLPIDLGARGVGLPELRLEAGGVLLQALEVGAGVVPLRAVQLDTRT